MLDKVNSGEPAVFLDERVVDVKDGETPFQNWTRDNLKNSYLTTDQLLDLHTILSDFDSEIGIPTVPYQKKERETEYESKSKVADGMARSLVWKRCIESSLKNVKKLYPELDITFKLRWEVEDVNNENAARATGIKALIGVGTCKYHPFTGTTANAEILSVQKSGPLIISETESPFILNSVLRRKTNIHTMVDSAAPRKYHLNPLGSRRIIQWENTITADTKQHVAKPRKAN
jgi:hypothetical protein